jgi:putative polyhydroxyalkanoate system protein
VAQISMKRPHDLGEDEIRGRIERLAGKISDRIGGSWEWDGNVIVSEARGANGRIGYDAHSITVDIALPKSMGLFRRKLEAKIDEYLIRFLETGPR